jgi:hypothetical protein
MASRSKEADRKRQRGIDDIGYEFEDGGMGLSLEMTRQHGGRGRYEDCSHAQGRLFQLASIPEQAS